MRGDATSNQAFQDWTLACPHRHLGALLLLSDLLAATAGTPALGRLLLTLLGRATASALGCRLLGGLAAGATTALRGGLLGATLLGCHADKFLQRQPRNNEIDTNPQTPVTIPQLQLPMSGHSKMNRQKTNQSNPL